MPDPLWLVVAVAVVSLSVDVSKRLLPRTASDWWPRVFALLISVGGAFIPGAVPAESPAGKLVLALTAGLGSLVVWHGARDLRLVKGRTEKQLEK
jgi:hypothetical protein